jgi:uncharacterized protein YjdB
MLRARFGRAGVLAVGVAAALGVVVACNLGTGPNGVLAGSVIITPTTATLNAVGATQQFTATVMDSAGTPLPGYPVAWFSSNTQVAAVDSTGLALALGAGSSRIIVEAGVVTDTANLAVNLPKATPVR